LNDELVTWASVALVAFLGNLLTTIWKCCPEKLSYLNSIRH